MKNEQKARSSIRNRFDASLRGNLSNTIRFPGCVILAFDQNPAGMDEGNEWVTIHNPSNESVGDRKPDFRNCG